MRIRFLFFLFWVTLGSLMAKDIPPAPNPPRLVNDFAEILSETDRNQLERKLRTYHDSTSTEIAVVIERSLDGEEIFDYSHRLAESWKIGKKGKDNGLLIYIAIDDRKVFFQVGYGLEGSITDAISKRIIESIIKPNFRAGNYGLALDEATDALIAAAAGEFVNDGKNRKGEGKPSFLFLLILLFVIIVISFINRKSGGNGGSRGFGSGPAGFPYSGRSVRSGGFGGFSSGSGGFGGFGGGGFGGGGAGGSW